MREKESRWLLPTLALLLAGCSGSQADTRFPTASEIARIAEGPPPPHVGNPDQKDVDAWDLKDPPAQASENISHTPANAWERLLADAANKRQGLLWTPEAMHCLARQAGQFVLAQGGIPSDELTRFMASRCGVADPEISLAHVSGNAPSGVSDEQLFTSGRASAEELIGKYLASGTQVAGIWAGQEKGKLVVMMPFGSRNAKLDRVPMSPNPNNHVVITGEVLTPADRVEALSNYGKFGFRHCTVDAQVRLPRFSLDCETSPDDASTAIEVAAFPAGRVMGRFIASLIVWPAGRIASRYERPSFGIATSMGTGPEFPANLVTALNQVRKDAGLGAVAFNASESATATRVAPHYFAALMGAAPESHADTIVLGLRAGWQVSGLVGYGHFTSSLTRKASDAGALLVAALNRPSGRETLLDPDIKVIAVGPVVSREESVLAGVFSTYTLLEPTATKKEVAEVLRVLNDKRKSRGLGPVNLIESLQGAAAGTARSIEAGQRSPDDAVHDLLEKSASALGGGVQGWFVAADKFDRLPFPDKLLTARSARVAMGIAHYKPEGSPWGAYGVLIVTASTGEMVASITDSPGATRSMH
jgi:hypothetical protein